MLTNQMDRGEGDALLTPLLSCLPPGTQDRSEEEEEEEEEEEDGPSHFYDPIHLATFPSSFFLAGISSRTHERVPS